MWAKCQMLAFSTRRVDLAAPRSPARLEGRCWGADDAGFTPDEALAPGTLDHLRRKQPGQRPPAGLGLLAVGPAPLGLPPVTVVGNPSGEVGAPPVSQKTTVWRTCHTAGAVRNTPPGEKNLWAWRHITA
jgi:hypothetical protein